VRAEYDGRLIAESWALNEVSVEKGQRAQSSSCSSTWTGGRCRGTAVTAWCVPRRRVDRVRFSPGGPVVWPEVEALLLVPISAHALFSKPLVTSPDVDVSDHGGPVHVVCGALLGRPRTWDLPPGRRSRSSRRAAGAAGAPEPAAFTDTLVAKFALPVDGGRGIDVDPRGRSTAAVGQLSVATDTVRLCWEELRITGLGVMTTRPLRLTSGMNVITGETGAGKTMVVTGLGLLFGGRAGRRPGPRRSGSCRVEGRLR